MMKKTRKTMLPCGIVWNSCDAARWNQLLQNVTRSNLLQSAEYGNVMARLNHQRVHRGVIMIGGQEAGLVQILEAGLLRGAVQGVIVDRAPLWFNGFGSAQDFENFMDAFGTEYPKRFGRRVRFIPEMPALETVENCLEKHHFHSKSDTYQTAWLDLSLCEEDLRKNLQSGWRKSLVLAEKSGLEIVISDKAQYFDWILENYARDKAQRGYAGVSAGILNALACEFLVGKKMLCATALLEGAPIAAIVIFIHGKSATYQVGYTSDTGRQKCAHHLLLWRVCTALKERAIYEFDLGGVNEEQSQGVFSFKKAMGAQIVETCGLYS